MHDEHPRQAAAELGGQTANGPIAHTVDGRKLVAVGSGHSLFVSGLPNWD